jgi:hypothetical protein
MLLDVKSLMSKGARRRVFRNRAGFRAFFLTRGVSMRMTPHCPGYHRAFKKRVSIRQHFRPPIISASHADRGGTASLAMPSGTTMPYIETEQQRFHFCPASLPAQSAGKTQQAIADVLDLARADGC